MKYILSLSIVAFIGLVSTVSAEPEPFEGQVVTQKSVPIHRAQVEIYRLDNPFVKETTLTDESGAFLLPLTDLVPPRPSGLGQNFPNPFNPSTIIPFEITEGGHVRLVVYNILGQRVVTLINEVRPVGFQRVRWDGTDALGRGVSAGVYIYRLSTGHGHDARKLVMLDGASGRAGGSAKSFSEDRAQTYGVKISGEEIISATFTWSPNAGAMVAKVQSIEDIVLSEREDSKTEANPFSKTSLASIIQVISGH